MGSHAKPRTTGRKAALSALALGATLTGLGLTAAALDPATAVLNAGGTDEGGAIQLSGLSTPVSLDLSPAADSITDLSAAPLQPVNRVVGSAGGSAGGTTLGFPTTTGSVSPAVKHVTSTPHSTGSSTGTENSIKPIVASTPGASSGKSGTSTTSTPSSGSSGSSSSGSGSGSNSGSTGKNTQPRSAAPPAADTALGSPAASTVSTVTSSPSTALPMVQSLLSKVPVGSVTDVVGSLPLVGSLLGGSGDGQSTVTVPGVSGLAGLL